MLQPVQLRTFAAVLSTGSFAEAAARLGFTASAVSQQVSALERSTGLVLFERGARSIRPTAAARSLGSRVDGLLAQLDVLEREVRVMAAGGLGVVRVGSFPTASAGLLPPALARLSTTHPDLDVLLDEAEPDELVPRLTSGALDLILVYEYDAVPQFWPGTLQRTPLLVESLVLLVGRHHSLASGSSVDLASLAGQTWAASREGTAGARSLDRLCAAAGFAPRVAYRSNDYDVVRGLVAADLGVALVPALAGVEDPRTAVLDVSAPDARRSVFALHRADDGNPVLGVVLDALARAGRARARSAPQGRIRTSR